MQLLAPDDSEWLTTFPCRVAPLPDEWLAGLLLRCDEVNCWESGTTFWFVTTASTAGDKQRWKRNMKDKQRWKRNIPSFFLPHLVNISSLAHYLGITERLCVSTTYYEELIRCYDLVSPQSRQLYPYFAFRICPACLAEMRLLRRIFLLPCLRYCPHHQAALLNTCTCGMPFFPFNQYTLPFICPSCHLDWARLPLIQTQTSHLETEQKLLSHFTWLLTQGTPALLMRALECIKEKLMGKIEMPLVNGTTWLRKMDRYWTLPEATSVSLGALAIALVSLNIFPQEVFAQEKPGWRIPLTKDTFNMQAVRAFLFVYATKPHETCDGGYA